MRVLLIYDIANDRARGKVADACEDFELDRTQFSAFSGELSRTHQESLMRRIRGWIEEVGGKVFLLPVAADDWDKRIELDIQNKGAPPKEKEKLAAAAIVLHDGPPPPVPRRPDDPF